jgi:acyl carrier protein
LKIQSLLGSLFPELERPLQADDSPVTVGGWDSLRQVEIILAVEETFGVALTTADIVELKSVGALVGILRRRGADVEL